MAVPNALTDGTYDPGATPASQQAGTLAQVQVLAQTHPEILQDPGIRAAGSDPAKLQTALQAWQHQHGLDPTGTYNDQGTLQNSSWFSDNLPWITTLMGGALGGAGLLTGGAAGGAEAGAAGGGLPSTTVSAAGALPTALDGGMGVGGAEAAGAAGGLIPATAISPAGSVPAALSGGTGMATGGGGTGSTLASTLKDLGQVAGSDAQNAAKGRLAQAQAQQGQDRNAIDLYATSFQNNLKAPATLASQAARGSYLQHVQPVQFSGLPSWISQPTMTGGPTPAALGPDARAAGAALSRNALLQLGKNQFNLPTAPSLTPLPQSSPYDAITSGLGRGASFLGAADHLFHLWGG